MIIIFLMIIIKSINFSELNDWIFFLEHFKNDYYFQVLIDNKSMLSYRQNKLVNLNKIMLNYKTVKMYRLLFHNFVIIIIIYKPKNNLYI